MQSLSKNSDGQNGGDRAAIRAYSTIPAQWQSAADRQSGPTALPTQPDTLGTETSLVGDEGPNQVDAVPPSGLRAWINKGRF